MLFFLWHRFDKCKKSLRKNFDIQYLQFHTLWLLLDPKRKWKIEKGKQT